MRRTLINMIVVAAVVVLASSCVRRGDIRIEGPGDFRMRGISGMEFTATVHNGSRAGLTLSEISVVLRDRGVEVAGIELREPVTIGRRTSEEVTLSFRIRYADPLLALSLVSRLDDHSMPGTLTVSGYAKARVGMGNKKIRFEDMPLSEFLVNFDMTELSGPGHIRREAGSENGIGIEHDH